MNQWLASLSHTGWNFHDIYWLGACVFIIHFIALNTSILRRKNALPSLILMTILWPATYMISFYQIMRCRRIRP